MIFRSVEAEVSRHLRAILPNDKYTAFALHANEKSRLENHIVLGGDVYAALGDRHNIEPIKELIKRFILDL